MEIQPILDGHQVENYLPFFAIVLGIAGVVLPAIVMSQARRIIRDYEQLAGPALLAATVIVVVGLLVAGAVVLAMIGWLPSPTHWM